MKNAGCTLRSAKKPIKLAYLFIDRVIKFCEPPQHPLKVMSQKGILHSFPKAGVVAQRGVVA